MAVGPTILKEHFESVWKCKISGIIQNVKKSEPQDCVYHLQIEVRGDNNRDYSVKGIMPEEGCILDGVHKVFFDEDIVIGKKIEYYLDNENNPLDFFAGTVDLSNITTCTGKVIPEIKKDIVPSSFQMNYEIFIGILICFILGLLVIKKYFFKK